MRWRSQAGFRQAEHKSMWSVCWLVPCPVQSALSTVGDAKRKCIMQMHTWPASGGTRAAEPGCTMACILLCTALLLVRPLQHASTDKIPDSVYRSCFIVQHASLDVITSARQLSDGLLGLCVQELRLEVELMDARGTRGEGPRLVARAWVDPDFKQRLLQVKRVPAWCVLPCAECQLLCCFARRWLTVSAGSTHRLSACWMMYHMVLRFLPIGCWVACCRVASARSSETACVLAQWVPETGRWRCPHNCLKLHCCIADWAAQEDPARKHAVLHFATLY